VPGWPRITRWSLWAGVDQLWKEGMHGYRQRNCMASDNLAHRIEPRYKSSGSPLVKALRLSHEEE